MATPGEKKALLFLSLVGVLGAGARLVAANQIPVPTDTEVAALEGQIRAVDSVRRGTRGQRGGRRRRRATDAGERPATADGAGLTTRDALTLPPGVGFRPPLVDVDRASADALESLPGIGPALARRIVASRDSSGTFGSLDALQARVRGVGPALAKRLAGAVTFSGAHSPPSAERTEPFGNGATVARGTRRRSH